MADFFTMKNIMNIAAWKEIAETGINFFQFVTGITKQVRPRHEGANATKAGEEHVRTDQAADSGKGVEDEHFYLIAPASAWWNSLSQDQKTAQKFDDIRQGHLNRIYTLFRENGQPGAAEKLRQIIGKETHLFVPKTSRKRQGQNQRNQAGQQANPPKEEEVTTEGKPERINPTGELFILFLTSMTPQQAVDMLNASSVSSNTSDEFAAKAKEGKEALKKAIDAFWHGGAIDTRSHNIVAAYSVKDYRIDGRPAYEVFTEQTGYQVWQERIEAETNVEKKRKLQEAFQKAQQDWVIDLTGRPEMKARMEREQGLVPSARGRKVRLIFKWVAIGIAIVAILAVTILASIQPSNW